MCEITQCGDCILAQRAERSGVGCQLDAERSHLAMFDLHNYCLDDHLFARYVQ